MKKFFGNLLEANPKTADLTFDNSKKEFVSLSESVQKTYDSLIKYDKNLKETFTDPSRFSNNVVKYFPNTHPLHSFMAENNKVIESAFNEWVSSQRGNYDLLQQYLARIKFLNDTLKDRNAMLCEVEKSESKIKALREKPSKDPHKLPQEQNNLNSKKESYEILNSKAISEMYQFFEDKLHYFDQPLINIQLSLSSFYQSLAGCYSQNSNFLREKPVYINPMKDSMGSVTSSMSSMSMNGASSGHSRSVPTPSQPSRPPPRQNSFQAPPPPPSNGGGAYYPSLEKTPPPRPNAPPSMYPSSDPYSSATPPPRPGQYNTPPQPGQYGQPNHYNPPPQPSYPPPQPSYAPPTQYQPPGQYQSPQPYQPKPASNYGGGAPQTVVNGYATSVVQNPEYQKQAGQAVSNKANDPNAQRAVGSGIANNTSNPYLKSAAGNSKVQGFAGKGVGYAAKNQQVQQAAGNAASNQINNNQYTGNNSSYY